MTSSIMTSSVSETGDMSGEAADEQAAWSRWLASVVALAQLHADLVVAADVGGTHTRLVIASASDATQSTSAVRAAPSIVRGASSLGVT
jgi:hypothetical protein